MESPLPTYDCLMKILLIGDSGVGKTCLLIRYADNKFKSSYMATIGVEFKTKHLKLGNNNAKLQIWDTAGQERFKTITTTYYKNAMGIMLVYDVTDTESFENVTNWVTQIQTHASANVASLLVANKIDKEERQISREQGQDLARRLGVEYFETSAKDGIGVNEAFLSLAQTIADMRLAEFVGPGRKSVSLNEHNATVQRKAAANNKKKCC